MTSTRLKIKNTNESNWNIIELLYVFQFISLKRNPEEIINLYNKLLIINFISRDASQTKKKDIAEIKAMISKLRNSSKKNQENILTTYYLDYLNYKNDFKKYNSCLDSFDFYLKKNYLFNSLTSQKKFSEEGSLKLHNHFSRERDWKIISAKKQQAIQENGSLECEACKFNFQKKYGERGHNYAEVHHIKPISKYEDSDITALDDLAILCSNCHRMIHRHNPWLTLEELKTIIKKQVAA